MRMKRFRSCDTGFGLLAKQWSKVMSYTLVSNGPFVPKNCASPSGEGGRGERWRWGKNAQYTETLPANRRSDVLETTGPNLGDGGVSFWRRRPNR